VPSDALAALACAHAVPLIVDLGSGTLVDLRAFGLAGEPTVREALAAGADLVTFSGDKLLGGPQAGVIAGRRDLVERIERHPLMRAIRLDKLTMAALEATLRLYCDPDRLATRIPVLRMLAEPVEAVAARAAALLGELDGIAAVERGIEETDAFAGGGSFPEQRIRSVAVWLRPTRGDLEGFAAALRAGRPSVLGRIARDRLLLDLRTVAADEIDLVAAAVRRAAR